MILGPTSSILETTSSLVPYHRYDWFEMCSHSHCLLWHRPWPLLNRLGSASLFPLAISAFLWLDPWVWHKAYPPYPALSLQLGKMNILIQKDLAQPLVGLWYSCPWHWCKDSVSLCGPNIQHLSLGHSGQNGNVNQHGLDFFFLYSFTLKVCIAIHYSLSAV